MTQRDPYLDAFESPEMPGPGYDAQTRPVPPERSPVMGFSEFSLQPLSVKQPWYHDPARVAEFLVVCVAVGVIVGIVIAVLR